MIYLILAGVAAAMLAGSYMKGHSVGAQSQIDKYAPIIEQCKSVGNEKPGDCATVFRNTIKDRDKAVSVNAGLAAELANARTDIEARNIAFDNLKRESDLLLGRKAAAVAASQPKIDALAKQNLDLYVLLNKKDPGGTCEQRLQALDAGLRDWGREQLRYNPAPAPGGAGGAVAPSGKDSRNPLLRIAP